MAAEIVGTALGIVGVLGQLFDGCVKAYGYFTTAANLDADGKRLLCKVRIEEMRLVVWGREWGVAEGRFDAHLEGERERNPQLRALAMQVLRELHATVNDFGKLRDKYGLADEGEVAAASSSSSSSLSSSAAAGGREQNKLRGLTPASPSKSSRSPSRLESDDGKRAVNGPKSSLSSERSWRKELSLRTKWVIADKEKFTNLLKDLKDFNDGLERLFPPSQVSSFQRAWTHQLLESAQRDLSQLSLLEKASSGIYPQLHTSANLKRLRINLDAKPQASFKPTFALKVPRAALAIHADDDAGVTNGTITNGDGGSGGVNSNGQGPGNSSSSSSSTGRCRAHHETAGDVVIEWIDYDRDAIDERVAHVRRLDDLARMMHSASEIHPDLHSIDRVGYTDDAALCRYGLVYAAPSSSFSTLHALIASPDLKTPDLTDRVRLARTLAVALWSLHSLDWLHKSLCASNVLFFPSAFSTPAQSTTAALIPDIQRPYISGFDASRPDLDTALSVVPRNPSIRDLHRHPCALRGGRSYCKSFDIYSLGLLLLEIGLWKVLQTYYRAHYSAERWRDKVVLPVLVQGLASKVGRRYKEVVEMCLGADEDLTSAEAGKLLENVVSSLESIRV